MVYEALNSRPIKSFITISKSVDHPGIFHGQNFVRKIAFTNRVSKGYGSDKVNWALLHGAVNETRIEQAFPKSGVLIWKTIREIFV